MRVKQPISFKSKVFWTIVGLLIMLMIYSTICYKQKQKNTKDTTIPNFSQLVEGVKQICVPKENTLKSTFGTGEIEYETPWILSDGWATYSRLFKSIFFGASIGVFIGLLMGSFEPIEYIFLWPVNILAGVPPTALLSVFLSLGALLGWSEEFMFIALVAFGITPTITRGVFLAVRDDLHIEEVDSAYSLGASHFEVIWNIMIPQILPKIIDNIRLIIGPAVVYLMAVEYFLGDVGFGYRIRWASKKLEMNIAYIYLLILSITSLGMNYGLIALRKWLCPWFGERAN